MRILIAIALLIVGASAAAQPRAVHSVDSITNLAVRYPISSEVVAVMNRTSLTNFGPIEFWRHAPSSTISTNATNAISAINGGRWLKTAVDGAGGTVGSGISGLLINGSGLVTNLVDSSSVTITGTNGQATFTATAPIFNGLLECLDDETVHTLTVTQLGTNYLLGVTQATNAPGPYATSIPVAADDLTTHLMRVRLVGTNYLLEITQGEAFGGGGGGGGTGNASTNVTQAWAAANTQTFLGPVYFGTTNVVTELAGKQNADAQLDVVANLTSGTATNFLAGDGTFKQVTTNMVPGLVADILAAAAAGGGGTGNADTNAANAWSQLQTFNGGIDASTSTNDLGVLRVTSIQPDLALDQSAGGTGGTNAETARIALGLDPDVDVQAYRLALKQLALAILASGDVPYMNSGGIVTNAPSTTFGRSLWNGVDAAAVRALLSAVYLGGDTMTGPLLVPYIGSVSGHTNVGSNQVATLRALAEVEARVSAGGLISAVDTNLEIVATVLKITNFNAGATGPIIRQSDLDAASVQATNSVVIEVLTNLTGTWTKPSGAKLHRVIAFGGGGGGGSGARGTNAWSGGGGGGAGGSMSEGWFLAAELSATVDYTNGVGGGGGVPATSDFSKGVAGTNGGHTYFGGYVFGNYGGGGGAGTTNTAFAAGGSATSSAMFSGSAGGTGSSSAGTGGAQGANITGRPGGSTGGGGGGGLVPAVATTNAPGIGGWSYNAKTTQGGAAGTVAAPDGADGFSWPLTDAVPKPGTGGGGGSPGTSAGGRGGNGGWPGGGGAGGAGMRNGTDSGAGGNGANGAIIIITHF